MIVERSFQVALLVSLVFHTAVFLQNSNLAIFSQSKEQKPTQLSYLKEPPEKDLPPIARKSPKMLEPPLKTPDKIVMASSSPPQPYISGPASKGVSSNFSLAKPEFIQPDVIAIKKKITLPPVKMDKMNNPSYISYYQIVREKIRRCAYQNYSRQETGEVYLSFIVSNEGYLRDVRVIQDKSSGNQYLKDIAIRSVSDASPFPIFPKELDYPQLSFNVIISFEIE
jgi:TonB family protein